MNAGQRRSTRASVQRRPRGAPPAERGFVLLAVLWVLVGCAALGLAATFAAREAMAASRNRAGATAATWIAEGCLARARAEIDGILAAQMQGDGTLGWERLDQAVARIASAAGCALEAEPAGARLDANAVDRDVLRQLLVGAGFGATRADSMSDALLDWRDADDEPRALGAERTWYRSRRRTGASNAPISDVREIRLIRGFEDPAGLVGLLGVEPGALSLNHAPAQALAALPGFGPELVRAVLEKRRRGEWIRDVAELQGAVSPAAAAALRASLPELSQLVTCTPEAWVVRGRAPIAGTDASETVEVRLARAGARAAVVRYRRWTS